MKKLELSQCNIIVQCLTEYTPVRGNALCSGDDREDKRCEDRIIRQLNNGNDWAWCTVKVTVEPKDGPWCELQGTDYLGCCSYKSKTDFIRNSGYYGDMVSTAFDELLSLIPDMAIAA